MKYSPFFSGPNNGALMLKKYINYSKLLQVQRISYLTAHIGPN